MKAIKCEMCNSSDVVKDGEFYVCQSCGTKYTTEAAKKLMVEGSVKIDSSDHIKNWLEVARRSKNGNDTDTAAKYYEMVMAEDPNNWEAAFYSMYCSSFKIQNQEIPYMAKRMSNSIRGIGELVFKIENYEERSAAIDDLNISVVYIANVLISYTKNYIDALPSSLAYKKIYEAIDSEMTSCKIIFEWGDVLYDHINTDESIKQKAINIYKEAFSASEKARLVLKKSNIYDYSDISNTPEPYKTNLIYLRNKAYRLRELDPTFIETKQIETANEGGCYVATCVYGSYDCPQVWTLRRYRDDTLGSTWYGRMFIRVYYAISPTIVKWFGKTKWFKKIWQGKLDRMVKRLNDNGVENTPYKDKEW